MHHKVQEQEDDVIHMSAIRTKFLNDHVHNLNYLHIKPLNSSSSNIYSLSLSLTLYTTTIWKPQSSVFDEGEKKSGTKGLSVKM